MTRPIYKCLVNASPIIRSDPDLVMHLRAIPVKKVNVDALILCNLNSRDKIAITCQKTRFRDTILRCEQNEVHAEHNVDPFLLEYWLAIRINPAERQFPESNFETWQSVEGVIKPPRIIISFLLLDARC